MASVKLNICSASNDLSVYSQIDSRSEKPARSTIITAVQRNMNKDTVVILDSLNYIKGFRYQLYCAAKEAGVRVCTVSASILSSNLTGLCRVLGLHCSHRQQMQGMEPNSG